MPSKTKLALLTGVAVIAISGGFVWTQIISPSHAADEHGHAEDEPAHDENTEAPKETHVEKEGHSDTEGEGHAEEEEGIVKLDAAQLEAAGIKTASVAPGALSREVSVPGKIVTAADRMAQIVPKVEGIVTEARKNLGDTVEKGEVLAVLESREMAEAVADYLAAKRALELARTTYDREKSLWTKKITAEQDYLNARNVYQEAQIKYDLTVQKLQALGHDQETLKKYDSVQSMSGLRFHEIRSPLAGRIIARELSLGEYVDTTHTAFTVADLSVLWVETAIAPGDLPFVKEDQMATVAGSSGSSEGKLIFISPAIDPETRSAKAIIELANPDGKWRPGEFATAAIETAQQDAKILIPKEAVQSIEGENVVFIQTPEGFKKQPVVFGREDSRNLEIVSGLQGGETIATSGTFTLKAEFGKAEAEHAH